MSDYRRVRPTARFFHIGELIAQRRDAPLAKTRRNLLHEGMRHPGAGPMGKHKTGARLCGADQKRGDRCRLPDRDLKLLRADDFHRTFAKVWPAAAFVRTALP